MKINVTVELGWLEEDSVDEVVQRRIVDAVVAQVSEKVVGEIKKQSVGEVNAKLDALVEQTYDSFLNKGVTITDRWGEVKKKDITIHGLIKEKCDDWLMKKVDSGGKEESYNANYTRMEWIVNNQLNKHTKEMSDKLVKQVGEEIKRYVNESVKSAIGEKLVKEIGLEEIINKAK